MKRRATLADVAAQAGVSVGTVSNVLTSAARVRPATRDRVLCAIRALDYRPAGFSVPAAPAPEQAGAADAGSRPLLVSAGYVSVDLVARIGVMPHRNDRVTAARISKQLGGPAANVAVAAAALGPPFALDVELATAIGKDSDSLWALQMLAERGVTVRAVRSPFLDRLSRCIVLVEADGQRSIINEPFELRQEDLTGHLHTAALRRRSHLHLEGYQAPAMLDALPRLRAAGWTCSVHDTGLPEALRGEDGFARLAEVFDTVFLNRRTAGQVLGRRMAADALVSAFAAHRAGVPGGAETVLTLGLDGAAVFRHAPGRPIRVPAATVDVVDGTGAGDCFVGVYLAQRLNGEGPEAAAGRAAVAASLSVTAEGAQGRRSTAREIAAVETRQHA